MKRLIAAIISSLLLCAACGSMPVLVSSRTGSVVYGTPAAFSPIRVNAGGSSFVDSQGNTWAADYGYTYSGGGASSTGAAIAGTTDDTLYQKTRWGAGSYAFTVPNGDYTVTLLFSENTFSASSARLFEVDIEGAAVLTSFDIFTEAGGAATAIRRAFDVTVADGSLDIDFVSGAANEPLISGIEVTSRTPPLAPSAVTDLEAIAGDGQITYTWTKSSTATSVNLYHSTSSPVTTGDTEVTGVTSPYVLSASNDTTVYAAVEAVNATGSSALSNEVSATPTAPSGGYVLYVSTSGNDSNDGSSGTPLLTWAGARDKLRALTGRTSDGTSSITGGWTGATVIFAAGTYAVSSPTAFDERDSGTVTYPIVYQAADGAKVVLTGAFQVSDGSWALASTGDSTRYAELPSATKAATYMVDLDSIGCDPGGLNDSYSSSTQNDLIRLIDDDTMQPTASYPDAASDLDASAWLKCTAYTNNADTLTVADATPAGWSVSNQNPYVQGCLTVPWDIRWTAVTSFASGGTGKSTLSINIGSTIGNPEMPYIRIKNALQALNTRGEWCLIQTGGVNKIYYYPIQSGAPSGVSLALANNVATFGAAGQSSQATNYVTLKNLILEGTRTAAIRADYSTALVLDGCEVRNVSGLVGGVHIQDSTYSGLINCNVHDTAVGAILLHGGDHALLDDAHNFITSSNVYDVGMELNSDISTAIELTKSPRDPAGASSGVAIDGLNCYNCRDGAIAAYASRLMIENSTFSHCCGIVGDAGAIGAGFFLTGRYDVLQNCTISNIVRLGDVSGDSNDIVHPSFGALNALYLDMLAGWTMQDNTFTNCDQAILLGAGKDHIIRRNKFTNCNLGLYNAPIIFAGRPPSSYEGSVTQIVTSNDLDAVSLGSSPWSVDFATLIDYRTAGTRRPALLYPENITVVDNMVTNGTYLSDIRSGWQAQTVSSISVGLDETQLNYPVGSSGTPTNGGGTVSLTSVSKIDY